MLSGIPKPHTTHFVAGTQLGPSGACAADQPSADTEPQRPAAQLDSQRLHQSETCSIAGTSAQSLAHWPQMLLRIFRQLAVACVPSEQQHLHIELLKAHRTDLLVCQSQAHSLTCATAGLSALHAANNVLSSLTTPIETAVITCKLLLGHELIHFCTSHLRCAPHLV